MDVSIIFVNHQLTKIYLNHHRIDIQLITNITRDDRVPHNKKYTKR